MNILISAYACRPNCGSEAGAAWRWVTGISSYHEVYVITEGEWRDEIEKELTAIPGKSAIHLYYNPVSDEIRSMCWNQGDYRFYIHYALWQHKTLEIAQGIMRSVKIDLIHQLNMIGFREPGFLWKIQGPKYVWGPIGGMNQVPLQYLQDAPFPVRVKYLMKNTVNRLQYHFHPRVQMAIKRADVLLAANKEAYEVLNQLHPEKTVCLINETGSNNEGVFQRRDKNKQQFDLLFVGRFIPTKLLGLALRVVASLKDLPGFRFHIVGKAFADTDTERYHSMAREMELEDVVEWHGWIPHHEVQDLMRKSDVFFFPSVAEGTPHVVLESIANGLPVVCFDVCGQAEAVNESVGRKIPLSNPEQSVKAFTSILKELYYNKALLQVLVDGCEKRREDLSWNNKVAKMIGLYNHLTNE